MEGELSDDIDWEASTVAAEEILAGKYQQKLDEQKNRVVI